MPSAVKAANGDYRPRFLAAIDACLEVMPSERPQSVAQLRAMLLGQSFYQKAIQWRISPPALGPAAWRWLASAATALALLAGGYGGLQYLRSPAIATEAHQRADAAAAGSADEQASTEARAQAEARRKQESGWRPRARLPKTAHARRRRRRRWPMLLRPRRRQTRRRSKKAHSTANGKSSGLAARGAERRLGTYRISIQNDQIFVPGLAPGKVNSNGKFRYKYVAVGWRNVPPGNFTGKFTGELRWWAVQLFGLLLWNHEAQARLVPTSGAWLRQDEGLGVRCRRELHPDFVTPPPQGKGSQREQRRGP